MTEPIALDGEHWSELAGDLDRAATEITMLIAVNPPRWTRGRPGKWTVGQHAEHVAIAMELPLPRFEESLERLHAGTLPPVPWRGPLQALFVGHVVRRGRMPRGGPARKESFPGPAPDRDDVIARIAAAASRYRALGRGLDAPSLDRLWVRNPFMKLMRWHYTLPEMTRMHAVHIRHHARQIAEL